MRIYNNKKRLLLSLGLLSGSIMLAIKNLIAHMTEISDFASGFFDGLACTLSGFGVICLMVYLIKYRTI